MSPVKASSGEAVAAHIPDYENPRVFQRNRLPARAYYLPETSLCLNGTWDFNYAPSPLHAPEPGSAEKSVIESAIDTTSSDDEGQSLSMVDLRDSLNAEWTTITVPGHWQLQGHGRPHYTNVVFPFPANPPFVPSENPTGTYRRSFQVPAGWDKSTQLRLRFDGVDSAYHVWLNGVEVGYAQGSRNPAEFDVSKIVKRDGPNDLFVRVYQWCDGSYIEDQDQWWLSGIFRDVHLVGFPAQARIEDAFVKTELDSTYTDAELRAALSLHADSACLVKAKLYKPGESDEVLASTELNIKAGQKSADIVIPVSAPQKWTAETPTLYKLAISLFASKDSSQSLQTIVQKVGFRKVEIKNGVITVNGQPILLRGVNRHDHHYRFGRAVPLSCIRDDLLQMKRFNINALRCSHYPSHPKLLELCDELGLWVMDEADLECHGFYDAVARPMDIPESMDYEERKKLAFGKAAVFTTDNPEWKDAYVDRMVQLIHRDKNHPSVIIWSLGNEAFYGQNHKAMYEYSRQVDPSRPVHYEGDAEALSADMYSYMYPSLERLIDFATAEGDNFTKPIVLCEYAHAMGNAPGGLVEYMDAFRKYRRLQGGFIWEWANHGLWVESKEPGKQGYYAYGGDFDDFPNDGDFVMDGLCYSDHSPTPGLVELKKTYEPVRAWVENDLIIVNNEYDFISLDDIQATFKVETFSDKSVKILSSGTLNMPHIPAGQKGVIPLPTGFSIPSTGETWLSVSFQSKSAHSWADSHAELAWFQHCLRSNKSLLPPLRAVAVPAGLEIQTTRTSQTIIGQKFSISFSRVTGNLTNWLVNEHSLLEPDPQTKSALSVGFWRPPTSNDMPFDLPEWRRYGLDNMASNLRSFHTARRSDGSVQITTKSFICTPILAWGFHATSSYTVSVDGTLTVSVQITPEGPAPKTVPRMGLDLYLADSLDNATWFGRGPGESYADKKESQKMGLYKADTAQLHTPYEVPQEGGNRLDTRWLRMANGRGWGLKAIRTVKSADSDELQSAPFQWVASRHSAQMIEDAKHPCDLVAEQAVRLRLDVASAGVGTGACGPRALEQYQVPCEESVISFCLQPCFDDFHV